MNTTKRMLVGAGAALGAVALVAIPLTAGAQDDDGQDPSTDEVRPHRPGRHRGPFGWGRAHDQLDTAAEVLGMDETDVLAALRDGRTLAELAAEQGVDVQAVIDAMVDEATAGITERITEFVNEGRPERPARTETTPDTTPDDPAPTTTEG